MAIPMEWSLRRVATPSPARRQLGQLEEPALVVLRDIQKRQVDLQGNHLAAVAGALSGELRAVDMASAEAMIHSTMTTKKATPPKMTMADAIAARKAARIHVEPATPSPQAIIDRKNLMAASATKMEKFACDLRVLCDMVVKLKRPDLDVLAKAIDKLEETIKDVRKGMR